MRVSPEDRRMLDALLAEINDPDTSPERREECRDDHSAIANGYVMLDLLGGDSSAWGVMEKLGIPTAPEPKKRCR
jgi:hypothetical protein